MNQIPDKIHSLWLVLYISYICFNLYTPLPYFFFAFNIMLKKLNHLSYIKHFFWEKLYCREVELVQHVFQICLCVPTMLMVFCCIPSLLVFPGGSDGQESVCNAGDLGLIPGSGRSPGDGNGHPLQYSYLENPMDRGA